MCFIFACCDRKGVCRKRVHGMFSSGINRCANGFQILNGETLKHVRKGKRMALRFANTLYTEN